MVCCLGSMDSTFESCWELDLSGLIVVHSSELEMGSRTGLSVCPMLENVRQTTVWVVSGVTGSSGIIGRM